MNTKRFELTQQDKVEAVKKLLTPYLASPYRHADMLAREILKLFPEPPVDKVAGYMKLANDQTFPDMSIPYTYSHKIQKEYAEMMYHEGWRKIMQEE